MDKRAYSEEPMTYCSFGHTYHVRFITEYYTLNPDHAPRKNPDLKCFSCFNPMPSSMPVWDGEAFICPIRKSELDAYTLRWCPHDFLPSVFQ
ncbi:hypothetical protein, partial [Endozoicomonas sp. ONNA2]|uniref:hypothetical protein n=1 Tax=Endozoicomonas sp. ONNA2 TaxID=2828741 RepID=UPI00214980AF